MSSSYRNTLNDWLAIQEVYANTVYDVGGAQERMPKRVRKWEVKDYLIFDLPEPHADSPKPDVEIDLNKFNRNLQGYLKMADIVYCLEVFDYVYDPVLAMKTLAGLLNAHGKLFASFPFSYPVHNPIEDDALRYTLSGIKKIADAAGLKIQNVTIRRPESNLLDMFWRTERLRAAKNVDHNVLGYIVEFSK